MCRTSFFKRPSYCTCGLYIRVNNRDEKDHFAFIDICEQQTFDLDNDLKFRYYNSESFANNHYEDLDCSSVVDKEEDDKKWDKVPVSFKYFKCAQLKTSDQNFCSTFIVSEKKIVCPETERFLNVLLEILI